MIQIKNNVDCCGCNACGDVCTHHAITFRTDHEGFWYPEVDKDKCVDCHLCESVCPIINIEELKKNEFEKPICYAAVHKNYEVRFDSTSGGVFSAFAEKFYRDKGYVGGAVYNDDWSVRQYISAEKTDLPLLRSSKYQQSNFEGFYIKVRDLLRKGERVLVCGSPCQMAALRSFLHYKDYDNLLILDFVCRGTNSPLIARKFNDFLESNHQSKIVYKKAKNKELGWKNLTLKVIFKNGESEYIPKAANAFTRGYLGTGVFCRPSCYDCRFKGFPRVADITLADFWGIEKVAPDMFDNIGTSLVLLNNGKGLRFFEAIQQKLKIQELPYETALEGNPSILQPLQTAKIDRDMFFKDAETMDFNQLADKYFPVSRISKRQQIKETLMPLIDFARFCRYCRFSPKRILQYLYLNYLKKGIHTTPSKAGYIWPSRTAVIQIEKGGELWLNAPFRIGTPRLKKSKMESRLLVEKGAKIIVDGNTGFGYGADVEVFRGKTLHFHGGNYADATGANSNLNLICGNHIEIGYGVKMGRGITIRDNNGGHYLNMQGYKESRPVIIGNHVWLCEGCTIMQGAKIGDGAVVGAYAVVTGNVPANTFVAGNPAQVIQTEISWKY